MNTLERILPPVTFLLGDGKTITSGDTTLASLDMDEMDKTELVMSVEEEFDIEIPDDQASAWVTVGDIVATVEGLLLCK